MLGSWGLYFEYKKTTVLTVVRYAKRRPTLTGGALNFHRRFPRLAMSGGFLRHLRCCDARVQSTLRFSLLDSLNSLPLPSLGFTQFIGSYFYWLFTH